MESTAITVSPAIARDLQALANLFDQYRMFYGQSANLEGAVEFLSDRLEQQDSVIFIAAIEGRAVGFAQLYPSFSSVAMQPIWILNDLYVVPDYRRLGVAKALMAAAKAHGQESKAIRIMISTQVSNLAAKSLYQSQGYFRDSEFDTYILPL